VDGGDLGRGSDPTVEKAQAMCPHQKPEAAFIAHRLLLDNHLLSKGVLSLRIRILGALIVEKNLLSLKFYYPIGN
jgi:hypothetical protein